jgi:hypothetical protein
MATMEKRMTWKEICERFPDQWVVMVDMKWPRGSRIDPSSATVLAHHRIRKDASPDVKAAMARGKRVACFWTGELVPKLRFL